MPPTRESLAKGGSASAFGRPSIAINRQDNVVHVAFIQADDGYTGAFGVSGIGDSDLYWYRKGYTACP